MVAQRIHLTTHAALQPQHLVPAPIVWRPVLRLAASIRRVIRARRTRAELSALDDRILKDIGLTRADIACFDGRERYRRSPVR